MMRALVVSVRLVSRVGSLFVTAPHGAGTHKSSGSQTAIPPLKLVFGFGFCAQVLACYLGFGLRLKPKAQCLKLFKLIPFVCPSAVELLLWPAVIPIPVRAELVEAV